MRDQSSEKSKKGSGIAGVVIWYRPQAEYLENLASYANVVDHTWVIDNSEVEHAEWLTDLQDITYVWLGHNHGIAYALNVGCQFSADAGFKYALTMDQDSRFNAEQICQHLDQAINLLQDDSVAIVTAGYEKPDEKCHQQVYERDSVITSGNVLRLSSWLFVGGFDSKLFIDQVDHDFCRRLRDAKYRILLNNCVYMSHFVGDPLTGRFLVWKITSTNHDWIRRYYHMRNTLYLREKYSNSAKPNSKYLREVAYQILGIIILEKEVILKLRAMAMGVLDFYRNKLGPWVRNDKTRR